MTKFHTPFFYPYLCIVERVRQALIEALHRKPLALGKAQTSFGSSLADAVFDILEQVMYTHIKIWIFFHNGFLRFFRLFMAVA